MWDVIMKWVTIEKVFFREVATVQVEYNCFDYCLQVLFVNVTVGILLWISMLLSALNISIKTARSEIVQKPRLKWETKTNWRGHEFFFEKITGPLNI